MSKSVVNQRLIYKIHSTKFRVKDWNLNIDFNEARENEEIVSLGDSITLRMIRRINKNNISEKEITKTKKKIKSLLKKKNKQQEVKEWKQKLIDQTLETDYLQIVFDTIADWNRANNGEPVVFNGKEYVRLIGTNNGIKENTVVFVNKEIYENLDARLNNGRDKKVKYVPAKFEAYKALACSCSTPVTQPNKILVIQDGVVNIKDDVLRLSDNGKGGFDLKEVDNYEIERNFTDGCGMISPKLAEQWAIDLGVYTLDDEGNKQALYIPTGFNIRNFSTKGMVFAFPYVEYGDEIGEYLVEDCWGDMVDIREVDLILTTNMVKLWASFKSCDEFMKKCKRNWFEFCVAKILPMELEPVRNMNYQFLQSYDFTDEDIQELIKPTVDNIRGAIGLQEGNDIDYGKMLLFLKGNKITEQDFIKEESDYVKALMVNKEMMKDPFIKQRVHKMIKKKINDSKKGVIQVNGNYSIISGDLYALCQFMFKKEVTGCLKAGEFYARTWLDKGVNKIVSYRAPMTIHNNIVKMNLVENEITKKYFRYMTTCTVLNAWDTTVDALNGADFDGDAVISTNNPVLLRTTKKLRTVICEQNSTEKKVITEKLLQKANKNGFGNDVGKITNYCTAMYDVLAKFEKDSPEYKEMQYRITCMQGYQQEIIDSCKGIIPKKVPKEWYKSETVRINDDDSEKVKKEKEHLKDLLADKKPYFFIYNYKHLANSLRDFNKRMSKDCDETFLLSPEELIAKKDKTDEEKEWLKYYNMENPISSYPSTMNRICWALEKAFDGILPALKDNGFDKSILLTDKKVQKSLLEQLEQLYKDYIFEIGNTKIINYVSLSRQEKELRRERIINMSKEKINELTLGDEEKGCNGLIQLLYDKPISKQFCWDMYGDYIVKKLLNDNNNKINVPIKDKNGEIEWNGEKYSLEKMEVTKC